jgi:hypothetical protein
VVNASSAIVEIIAATRKRGRSRNASKTRLGSKKIPVKVWPVDMVAAPVVSATGCDGGGGGTKSLLFGSLIVNPPWLLEDGETKHPSDIQKLLNTTMIREVRLRGFKTKCQAEVQSTRFSLLLPNHFNLKVGP